MRIIAAFCSAVYSGRGNTTLAPSLRAIIIKSDGSVSVHNDASNKPLNYMKCATQTEEVLENGNTVWTFDARNESLHIEIHQLVSDITIPLSEEEPGLVRDGTESHLQEWISNNPEALGEGWTFVEREFATGRGPVDLLMRDEEGRPVAVEVKRVAMLGTVGQIRRYVEAIIETEEHPDIIGVIAALDIRPKTLDLATKHGIRAITLPADWNEAQTEGRFWDDHQHDMQNPEYAREFVQAEEDVAPCQGVITSGIIPPTAAE